MRLRVSAPARLHFGLLQIDPSQPHCYGGLGLMLQSPETCLSFEPAQRFEIEFGPNSFHSEDGKATIRSKLMEAMESARRFLDLAELPSYRLVVESYPRLHSGLGTGTQLACCAATLAAAVVLLEKKQLSRGRTTAFEVWSRFQDSHRTPHSSLAEASGRGKRSHIGLEGFLRGGWIFDEGQCRSAPRVDDTETPRCRRNAHRLDFPDKWQMLLFISENAEGLSGEQEQASFNQSEGIQSSIPTQMYDLACSTIPDAIVHRDLKGFGTNIQSYNQMAGLLFQHTNTPTASRIIIDQLSDVLGKQDLIGFGQTSWGPTMWAIMPREVVSETKINSLQRAIQAANLPHVKVLPIETCHSGAILEITD